MAVKSAAHPLSHRDLGARVRLIVLIAIACAAAWLAMMAHVGVWRIELLQERRVAAAQAEARTIADVGGKALGRRLDALRTIPVLLADQERFGRTLDQFNRPAQRVERHMWYTLLWRDEMRAIDGELDVLAERLNLEYIFLVTQNGFVVASSDGEGHLGTSFEGRDHFQQTLATGNAESFGVDPVSGAPMFFFSHRIEHDGESAGAVIVATSSARMLLPIERGTETVFLSDRNDVVVVASDFGLLFRSIGGNRPGDLDEEVLMLRYGRSDFDAMPDSVLAEEVDEAIAANAVHVGSLLAREQMTVHIVAPLQNILASRRDNLLGTLGVTFLGVLLTGIVAMALIQFAAMRERATRDPLTGLSNRRYADEILPELLAIHDRQRVPGLAFASFDLDCFKKVNDSHGHAAGDRVLRRFAQVLQQTARRADLVFRYGGEEFTAVLVEPTIDGAVAFAERVREATAAMDNLAPVPAHTIRVSAGVVMRREGETLDQVMMRADEMLYQAKANGRDRVEFDPA